MELLKSIGVLDKNGRIALQTEMLNAAGLEPGDEVCAIITVRSEADENPCPLKLLPCIAITKADILALLPRELLGLFDELGINPDTVREVMKKEGYFV